MLDDLTRCVKFAEWTATDATTWSSDILTCLHANLSWLPPVELEVPLLSVGQQTADMIVTWSTS